MSRNAIKCKECGTEIESTYRHDFKGHTCDALKKKRGDDYFFFVDGGTDYQRRGGYADDWEELT